MPKQDRLEEIHGELITAIDSLNCAMAARDADGIVLWVSERLLSWLSYTEEEVVGQSMEMFFPPEIDAALQREAKLIEAGDPRARITILRRKDGTTFPILSIPQRRHPGDEQHPYFSVIVDLATVQTARPAGTGVAADLRARLDRIALEIQSIGLTANVSGTTSLPLEHPALKDLSDREREVLAHLVAGERVSAIAKRLFISPHTVRNHLKSVYRELGVGNQSDLIEMIRSLAADSD